MLRLVQYRSNGRHPPSAARSPAEAMERLSSEPWQATPVYECALRLVQLSLDGTCRPSVALSAFADLVMEQRRSVFSRIQCSVFAFSTLP